MGMAAHHMNPQSQSRSMAQQHRSVGPAPAVRVGANQNAQPQFRRPMQTQQMSAPQRQIRAQTPMHSQQTRTIAQSAENNLRRNVVSAPTPMTTPLQGTVPAPKSTPPQMVRPSPMMASNRMDPQAHARARSQHITSLLHSRRPTPVVRVGVNQQTQQIQPVGSDKPQATIGAQKPPQPTETVAPVMSQFAHPSNSNMAPSDDTVASSRSSISSVSPDSRVRRSTTSQFMPSEVTAKRDVYDFKLKRDMNARPQSGIVSRQLNAAKTVSDAPWMGISLRNTLGVGLEHAGSAALQQRVVIGRKIRLDSDVIDANIEDSTTYYCTPKAPTYCSRTMSKAQKRRARRNKMTTPKMSNAQKRRARRSRKAAMMAAPKMSKAQKRKLRRKALKQKNLEQALAQM